LPFVVGPRIVVSWDVVLEAAMVSWLEELDRREAAAREEIAELRDRIEALTSRLTDREEVLSRLEITRETMTEILSADETITARSRASGRS
jgi:predicted  nucleic acid-binding Zn-ribbon protein